jgi:hypothetical protein
LEGMLQCDKLKAIAINKKTFFIIPKIVLLRTLRYTVGFNSETAEILISLIMK